jgi:hypothetical protein
MVDTLHESFNKEFVNITPFAAELRSLLTSYCTQTNSHEQEQYLTEEEAKTLLSGLEQQQILFAVSKNSLDTGIHIDYPKNPVPGAIYTHIHDQEYKLPLCVEGVVLTFGRSSTAEQLKSDPLSIKRLHESYEHHAAIPYHSPYDSDGKAALPKINHWFNKFADGEQWDDLPQFVSDRYPERYAGYYAYTQFMEDIAAPSRKTMPHVVVGRYTLQNKQILLPNPTYYPFPNS